MNIIHVHMGAMLTEPEESITIMIDVPMPHDPARQPAIYTHDAQLIVDALWTFLPHSTLTELAKKIEQKVRA